MSFVPLDLAKQQCRVTHSLQDDLIQQYIDQAEGFAIQYLDRNIYPDSDTLIAAIAGALALLTTANDTYNTAIDAANAMDCGPLQESAIFAANNAFQEAQQQYERTICGVVVFPVFKGAALLLVSHFYEHPSAVSDMRLEELPIGFQNMLFPYRKRLGV